MLTGRWWMAGGRKSGRWKRIEEKKRSIYIVGASIEVLTEYESCIQSEGLVLTC